MINRTNLTRPTRESTRPMTAHERRRLAVEAAVHPATVERYLAGEVVRSIAAATSNARWSRWVAPTSCASADTPSTHTTAGSVGEAPTDHGTPLPVGDTTGPHEETT